MKLRAHRCKQIDAACIGYVDDDDGGDGDVC